ncbi:MAG: MurR/RpiR family transcriptional regulator [Bulleidia sp.]
MSLQSRIQDVYPEFTQSERQIADYFLNHLQEVSTSSAKDLAERCGTSAPTIVRFSRTLGYNGFPALKMDILMSEKNDVVDLTQEIEENETVARLVSTMYTHRKKTLESVRGLIDESLVEKAVSAIETSGMVYLCGIGGSGIVCQDFCQKLSRIGIHVIYAQDPHFMMTCLSSMREKDVLVAISYSGETNEVIETVRIAKEKGAVVIGISQLGKTTLNRLSDMMFYVPMEENTVRAGAISSRDSSLFICDTIYLVLMSRNLKENKQILSATKNWTNRL